MERIAVATYVIGRPPLESIFSQEDIDTVVGIYDARPGGYDTVDLAAVTQILAKYPDVPEEDKQNLTLYAGFQTR